MQDSTPAIDSSSPQTDTPISPFASTEMQDSTPAIDSSSPQTDTPISPFASIEAQAASAESPTISAVCMMSNRIIGSRVRAQGEAVELTDQRLARRLYSEGVISVADITSLGHPAPQAPPQAVAAAAVVEPFPCDPIVSVVVQRDGLMRLNSVLAKGAAVGVPERTAVEWTSNGSAVLADGASLSSRGQIYMTKLQSKNPSEFGATY